MLLFKTDKNFRHYPNSLLGIFSFFISVVTGHLKSFRDQDPSFAARPARVRSVRDSKMRIQQDGAGEESLSTHGCSSGTLHRCPCLHSSYILATTHHHTPEAGSASGRLLAAAPSTAYPRC